MQKSSILVQNTYNKTNKKNVLSPKSIHQANNLTIYYPKYLIKPNKSFKSLSNNTFKKKSDSTRLMLIKQYLFLQ